MRKVMFGLLFVAVTGCALAQSQSAQPSLADVARAQREAKKNGATKHVYTNEDLAASTAPLNTPVITPSRSAEQHPEEPKDAKKNDEASKDSATSKDNAKQVAPELQYRNAVQKQRAEIAKLEQEVAEQDRKVKTASTNYYLDAGSRLRDPKAWTQQREKMDKEIAEKQEKLQAAKSKLDDLLDQARKLGIPANELE